MIGTRHKLHSQLSLAMIFTAITSLFIFIVGMAVFYVYLEQNWVNGLSDANQKTLKLLIDNETVDADALTTLVSAFSLSWSGTFANQEALALLLLIIITILAASIIGILFAKRFSKPIEVLTAAANKVAGGSIDVRVNQALTGSLESKDLFISFNKMTSALEQAERESAVSAAAIAHELRTPLTILKGRLQGFREGVFEPSNEMYDALIGQVDMLTNIADDLGMLSKLSSGQFQLEATSIDLADEVKRVITALNPDLKTEGIELHTSLEPAKVFADPARVRQALTSLIENVRRYAASGKYIKIETTSKAPFAVLKVTDHGPGIPESDWSRVFDRWWRGENSRTRSQGGSGLGLSIVEAIALAHKGFVTVSASSPNGSGCCFSISLPMNGEG